jgi:glycerol-3-phosphate dehydrogenase
MPGFEPSARARNLERLACEPFDVLVIGGGITGAGVAREATLRGLSVAVVEARDFASGTSSRSSKLIHGGLRYLQQAEIALVREAATERTTLRRIAPHLTATAPMLVPVYGRTSAGVYKLRLGLTLFDKLAAVGPSERHRILSRDEALTAEPTLVRERLQGAAVYPEYVTDDARLVLDTLKAAHHAGAVAVNYARVTALGPPGAERQIEVRDGEGGGTLTARARVVVNAAGPWVDAIRALDRSEDRPVLHLTKGIHLVFRAADLPIRHCVVLQARDKRPVFAVPRGDYVYVGTTDTSYEGPLEEPEVTAEDASYLLEAMDRTFANGALGVGRIVGSWAGLRPLVHEEGRSPSEISRKDEIAVATSGLITIAGGKLTTYRRMAERVLDAAASFLGPAPSLDTGADRVALAGGDLHGAPDLATYARSAEVCAAFEGVPPDTASRLIDVHGSDALEVVQAAGGSPEALVPLAAGVPLTAAEVRHAVRREMACTLTDVLERRSRLALFATEAARAVAPAVAGILAEELGWSAARVQDELAQFDRQAVARLRWRDGDGVRGGS